MALQDVIAALAEHWDDACRYLGPRDLDILGAAIRRIQATPQGQQPDQAAADLTTILAMRLPSGHPVLAAIAGGSRLVGAPVDWSRVANLLRALPDADTQPAGLAGYGGLPTAGDRSPDRSDQAADSRLLAAPALTAPEVRDQGGNPDRDDLIRLSPESGAVQLPAFQFGPDGRPIPVVLTINRMLEAAEDPWGVADWWLGKNAWLDGSPADLLGHIDDALLVMAARAEFPEE
jgi:hypothetical protein